MFADGDNKDADMTAIEIVPFDVDWEFNQGYFLVGISSINVILKYLVGLLL